MSRLPLIALLAATVSSVALAAAPSPPPALPRIPISETLFGTTIVDPYRYMEDEKNASVIEWMKAEGRYSRAVLDAIPGHQALLQRISALTGSFDSVGGIQRAGGRMFFLERAPGLDNYDLLVRDSNGKVRKLIDVTALRAAHGGTPMAINYFKVAADGSRSRWASPRAAPKMPR